jgi:cysteine desulfurase/selenocysteine lyase
MIEQVKWTGTTYNKIPFKFEAGTPDIAGAIGLAEACRYINSFDRNLVLDHEHQLLDLCTQLMLEIPGLRVVGQAPEKTSVFSFNIAGVHPYDLGTILDQQGIAVRTGHHCAQPLMDQYGIPGTVRASFAFYNTHAEVECLVAATKKAVKILS